MPTHCARGDKKDPAGWVQYGNGYALHVDLAEGELPGSAVTTSAALHDSQVAIPLARLTSERVHYLYDLMEAAYDAVEIDTALRELGHVPIIAWNPRRRGKGALPP